MAYRERNLGEFLDAQKKASELLKQRGRKKQSLSLDEAHVLQVVSDLLGESSERREDTFYGSQVAGITGIRSGVLYPLLERLEVKAELFDSKMEVIDTRQVGRPARRFYSPTPLGRRVLGMFQEESDQEQK